MGLPLYSDIGWASLRSSWNRNATLLGVKSGYTWNHAHADAGSFVLFHEGENILIDSGKCSYFYFVGLRFADAPLLTLEPDKVELCPT